MERTGRAVGVGLIGAGRIGRLHAENLRGRIPGAELLSVCDVNAAGAKQCAEELGIPQHGAEPERIWEQREIAAVLICSSTDTHAEFIEAAAAAGKHIFCEKPIDFDLRRIDRALAAVERAGVVLQIGFNRRFDPHMRRARRSVVSGEIGAPQQLHIISRDPGPPPLDYIKKSGGLFMDMAIHDFDMARFLIGTEVEEVFATGSVHIDPAIGVAGDVDTATTLLRFANGVVGTIQNSRKAVYGYDQRVEVFGGEGSVAVDNPLPNAATIRRREGSSRDRLLEFFLERYAESYVAEMAEFLDAIAAGAPPPVSGRDGRQAAAIAQAAALSRAQNRPVRLAEIDSA